MNKISSPVLCALHTLCPCTLCPSFLCSYVFHYMYTGMNLQVCALVKMSKCLNGKVCTGKDVQVSFVEEGVAVGGG
jgi:hypothetical protein